MLYEMALLLKSNGRDNAKCELPVKFARAVSESFRPGLRAVTGEHTTVPQYTLFSYTAQP